MIVYASDELGVIQPQHLHPLLDMWLGLDDAIKDKQIVSLIRHWRLRGLPPHNATVDDIVIRTGLPLSEVRESVYRLKRANKINDHRGVLVARK